MENFVRTDVTGLPDPACQRARCLVSLDADGEATEFERAFLASHLADCAACAAYSVAVEETAATLRAAPLAVLPAPVTLPSRRGRFSLGPVQAAAVALVVLGAGLAGLSGMPQRQLGAGPTPTAANLASTGFERHVIHSARRWPPDGGATLAGRRTAATRPVSLGAHAQPLPR